MYRVSYKVTFFFIETLKLNVNLYVTHLDIMILITVMGKLKYDFLRVTAVVAPVLSSARLLRSRLHSPKLTRLAAPRYKTYSSGSWS